MYYFLFKEHYALIMCVVTLEKGGAMPPPATSRHCTDPIVSQID